MGLRFRRCVKLAPGIRMNLSGSGVSWGLGPRGASIGIGRRGTYLNTGIPGTGLYSRERIGSSGASSRERMPSQINASVTIEAKADGTLDFRDADGNPLPDHVIHAAKKQQGDAIRDLIKRECDEINAQIEALGEIHLYTPNPNVKPQYEPQAFPESPPTRPTPKKVGLLGKWFKSKRERLESENLEEDRQFERGLQAWRAEKQRFDDAERRRRDMIERGIYCDTEAMASFLEENLQNIVWPRETTISIEVLDGGDRVFVDVDLPEIEEMPSKTASAPQRGFKFSV